LSHGRRLVGVYPQRERSAIDSQASCATDQLRIRQHLSTGMSLGAFCLRTIRVRPVLCVAILACAVCPYTVCSIGQSHIR